MRPTIISQETAISPEGLAIQKQTKQFAIPSQAQGMVDLAGGFYGDPNQPQIGRAHV